MVTEERVMTMLTKANPSPDDAETDTDAVTYLATLEKRSSEVTQLKTRQTDSPKSGNARWLAIAAVVVIFLGLGVVLLTRSNEEPPPATDPTPTTVVVPTTEPEAALDPQLQEALAVATALMQARADRQFDAFTDAMPEGRFESFIAQSVRLMPDEFAWLDAVGWTIDIEECELTSPDVENTNVECQVLHHDALSVAIGSGPFAGSYTMKVGYAGDVKYGRTLSDTVVYDAASFQFPSLEFTNGTWRPFMQWLEANHPEDLETMLGLEVTTETTIAATLVSVGERKPSLTPESIDLWRAHVAEFVAEQG